MRHLSPESEKSRVVLLIPVTPRAHEFFQIHAGTLIQMVTVRDATGLEITVPHDELLAGFEYRGNVDWVPETDPRVLDWLESEVKKRFQRSDCGSVDRDNEARMARNREIRGSNGRALEF